MGKGRSYDGVNSWRRVSDPRLCRAVYYKWPGQDLGGFTKTGIRSQLIVWQGNDGILYFPLLGSSKQSWLSLSRQGGPCVLGICPGTRGGGILHDGSLSPPWLHGKYSSVVGIREE